MAGTEASINGFHVYPKNSFQSWGNYFQALMEIPHRLLDRIMSRSLDQTELVEVKAESQHEMKKTLTWWDVIWFGMGAVIGSGIFVLTGLETQSHAGPAVVLSYVIPEICALISVFCYTEFAVEIPVASGSFAYLRVELGDFVAFIAAGNIIIEYVIGEAALARSWTSYFATLCNHHHDDFRIVVHSLPSDYQSLDPIAVVVIFIICILAVISTKASSRFNYVASIVHLIVIILIIIAGLTKANPKNYAPFAPFGARGMFQASAGLFFAYVGFDAVSTVAEETKNPARDIPIGLFGSMVITTLAYCLLAMTLCLMQPCANVDKDAPYSVAFQAVGMGWAKYRVALGALKGMTSVLLVGAVGQARYLTHIARTHMMPHCLAKVHERTKTTVRRYYVSGVTTQVNRIKLIVCLVLILGSSFGTAVYWAQSDGWIGYTITVPIWFVGAMGLRLFVPHARNPRLWGVPLVPWLPSASIAINFFLLGSIDKASYLRFGIWTGILMVYYLFFGLHLSYDDAKAKASRDRRMDEQSKVLEEVPAQEFVNVGNASTLGAT